MSAPSLAIGVYLHRLRAAIAAMIAAIGGIDVIAFTGGVGEGSEEIRNEAVAGLEFLGTVSSGAGRACARGSRDRSPDAGAARVLTIGGIHLYLWFDYFHKVHVIGALFLANAATGVLISLWLLAFGGVLALLAGAGFAATTLAGLLISVHWGCSDSTRAFREPGSPRPGSSNS